MKRARVSLLSVGSVGDWDVRRFRPNVFLDGEGEDDHVGELVRIGSTMLSVQKRLARCVMVTRAQSGIERDLDILREINRDRDTFLAVGALVEQVGRIAVEDEILVVRGNEAGRDDQARFQPLGPAYKLTSTAAPERASQFRWASRCFVTACYDRARDLALSRAHGRAMRVTGPPMGAAEPQLWMAVDDVFHIRGRGTVVTGQLQGDGQLSVGDALLCDDGRRWQVSGIEQLHTVLMTAEPGSNIGVFLDAGPALQMLRGTRVWFEPAAAAKMSTPFTAAARRRKRWRG